MTHETLERPLGGEELPPEVWLIPEFVPDGFKPPEYMRELIRELPLSEDEKYVVALAYTELHANALVHGSGWEGSCIQVCKAGLPDTYEGYGAFAEIPVESERIIKIFVRDKNTNPNDPQAIALPEDVAKTRNSGDTFGRGIGMLATLGVEMQESVLEADGSKLVIAHYYPDRPRPEPPSFNFEDL